MKRFIKILISSVISSCIILNVGTILANTPQKIIKLKIGNKIANINGQDFKMDIEPYIQEKTNSTMIPLKSVSIILGISEDNINFDAKTKSIKIQKDNDLIEFFVGNYKYKKNGVWSIDNKEDSINMPIVEIKNGKTFVPFRTLGEVFGLNIEWDNVTKTAIMKENTNNFDKEIRKIEEEVIKLVNEERAKANLQPLQLDEELMKCAKLKSEDMVKNNYFEHTSPTYGTVGDMMKQYNIKYSIVGENIADGYLDAKSVVDGWMNSKAHKDNILSPKFKYIGVGLKDGMWSQIFKG